MGGTWSGNELKPQGSTTVTIDERVAEPLIRVRNRRYRGARKIARTVL